MRKARALVCAVVAVVVLGLGSGMVAHEGHTHTVMGTVSALIGATQLVVKTTAGEDVSITLNDKTTVTRGKGKLTLKDVAVGQRVVVNVGEGKTPYVARDIKLGVATTVPSGSSRKPHGVAVGSGKAGS